jgi:hypothetical protein
MFSRGSPGIGSIGLQRFEVQKRFYRYRITGTSGDGGSAEALQIYSRVERL